MPSFERPAEAVDEGFITASVPNLPEDGAVAQSIYGKSQAVNVFRAVSPVPQEARRVVTLIEHQYMPGAVIMDFGANNDHALSRAQLEVVATKVSEHNMCFCRATGHPFALRESGKIENQNYNLVGSIDPTVDSGVEHGRALVNFTAAVAGDDEGALQAARDALIKALNSAVVVNASLITANFSMLDRIANVTGIGLDGMMVQPSIEIRELLGVNEYLSAANTLG